MTAYYRRGEWSEGIICDSTDHWYLEIEVLHLTSHSEQLLHDTFPTIHPSPTSLPPRLRWMLCEQQLSLNDKTVEGQERQDAAGQFDPSTATTTASLTPLTDIANLPAAPDCIPALTHGYLSFQI